MKWLLVSALDETLFGDPLAWGEFANELTASPDILVAVNSNRPWKSVDETLQQTYPPFAFDAQICGVGTEILIGRQPVSQWNMRFCGWDRACVDRVMSRLGFAPQHPRFQTPFKASYIVSVGSNQLLARNALAESEQSCHIVCSGESDFHVLPPQAGKGGATLFLAEHLGVQTDHLIVAGVSANDVEMLHVAEKGIVVSNAHPELRQMFGRAKTYFAKAARAAGVLEGLRYWGAPLNSRSVQQS